MKLPKPAFRGGETLRDILEGNRREEEARRERFREFALADFFLNLRSRDKLGKVRVRRALPARDDAEVVEVALRLMAEASADYLQLRMQWQREAVGYLSSLALESHARLGGGEMLIPDGLDYVGMQAQGSPEARLALRARRVGNFAGLKSFYLDIRAETAGKCLGEEAEELRLQAREVGDWLMLKSRRCYADARKVGRLAGLDSHMLEMHVHSAGAELGARAREAVIYVYREAKSLGLRGSGVVYMRHGSPPWRTTFRVEKMP